MAANTLDVILARINSLCADAPFDFVQASSPFDFDQQPTGEIDQVFRVTAEGGTPIGGFNYTEERIDTLRIWVARKHNPDPHTTYAQMTTDAASLTAAIVRDGATGGGDFDVPDAGRGCTFSHDRGREFAVMRLSLQVDYEAQL